MKNDFSWIKDLEDGETATPIKGFPRYYVTSYGKVYSAHFKKVKQLKQYVTSAGSYYRAVMLRSNGKYTCINVHTLVGRNLLPNYREGMYILHRDETLPQPQVNYLSNLWVGDSGDNQRDAYAKGRKKPNTEKARKANLRKRRKGNRVKHFKCR